MSRQAGEPGDAHLAEGLTQVPYVVFVYTETLGTKSEIGYSIAVEIEFDPAKDVANVEKHGVSLARAADLVPVAFVEDDRFEEPRYRVQGLIDGLPYCLAFTDRGDKIRVISLRRVHAEEMRRYVG